MALPSTGQSNWGIPLNNYITNVVLAEANTAQSNITTHVTGADPHGDRAYALNLMNPITTGVNGPNGFVQLNSIGKLPTSILPPGGGRTSAFDVVKDYGAPTNGVIDASPALQNALNDCATSGGGEVWVGDGVYGIGETLHVGTNTWLHLSPGAVMRRMIGSNGQAPTYMLANFNGSTSTTGAGNLLIEGGTWLFDSQVSSGAPMAFVNGQNILVRGTVIELLQGNPAVLVAGCTGLDILDVIFTCTGSPGARAAMAANPPAVRIEATVAAVISGLSAPMYTGAGCTMVGVTSCALNAATGSDGFGLLSAVNGLVGTTAPVSGTFNTGILILGNATNAVPQNGVTAANWSVMTVTSNQFNLTNGVPAGVSWSPSAPAGVSQIIASNVPADTYGSAYDSWHDMTLTNGWTNFGTRPLTYKFVENGEFVHFSGQINYGNISDGTIVGSVSTQYAPRNRPEALTLGWDGNVSLNGRAPYLEIQTGTGNVLVYGVSSVSGSVGHFVINGRYAIDAQ